MGQRPSLPAPGDVLEGKIEIVRLLGAGGMGAVFEAKNRRTGRHVAVKMLRTELATDADACQRFVQEALACGRVQHPNVVDIYDAGVHEGAPYLVMELLRGEALGARIERLGRLPIGEAIELVLGALAGVGAAHEAGIVHRDLKPDNLFLCEATKGGAVTVKVVDFGISKVREGGGSLALTRTGTLLGTPRYMSPEQARGLKDIDVRADVYALGVVLYHALTGRVPFEADNYNALVVAILTEEPPTARQVRPEIPAELDAVLLRAMARDRAVRYQTAAELANALVAQRPAASPQKADGPGTILPERAEITLKRADSEPPVEPGDLAPARHPDSMPGTPFAVGNLAPLGTALRGPRRLLVGAAALMTLGAAAAFLGTVLSRGDEPPAAPPPQVVVPLPAAHPRLAHLVPIAATASSSFSTPDASRRYPPEDSFDGDPATAWNTMSRPRPAEWLEATLDRPHLIQRIRMSTGYDGPSARGDAFQRSAHVKRLRILLDGGHELARDVGSEERSAVFEDIGITATTVRFVFDEVWRGTRWPQLAISEITIEGD